MMCSKDKTYLTSIRKNVYYNDSMDLKFSWIRNEPHGIIKVNTILSKSMFKHVTMLISHLNTRVYIPKMFFFHVS